MGMSSEYMKFHKIVELAFLGAATFLTKFLAHAQDIFSVDLKFYEVFLSFYSILYYKLFKIDQYLFGLFQNQFAVNFLKRKIALVSVI